MKLKTHIKLWVSGLLVLGIVATCFAADFLKPGSIGVSYKNNTAYLGAVVIDTDGNRIERWQLRTGHSDEWAIIEKGYEVGTVSIFMKWQHPQYGLMVRAAIYLNRWPMLDTGWRPMGGTLPEGVTATVRYMIPNFDFVTKGTGRPFLNTVEKYTLTYFKDSSRENIEGMIWDMSWKGYYGG